MRWLWQQGIRWAAGQAMGHARRAATGEQQDSPADAPQADSREPETKPQPVAIAFLCQTKLLFDAVADELSGKRQIEADRMAICAGKLSGQPVVVARPLGEAPDHARFVKAIVNGHRPGFALSAAEATSLQQQIAPATIVMASRVFDAAGRSLRIDGQTPKAEGLLRGGVATQSAQPNEATTTELADPADAPLAEDTWSEPLARACGTAGLPLMVAAVVVRPPVAMQSKETAALKHQRTLAGKTGVLAGMMWKKRSGIRDLWNEKEATWNASSSLAALAKHLAKAAAG